MESLSSFLVDLLANHAIGSLDVDHISIVQDTPRLPSKSLINMNRRAMGMLEDFQEELIFSKKDRKEKNRWEAGLVLTTSSVINLAVQDPASPRRPGLGSKARSDSMLMRPRRQPGAASPDSSPILQQLLTNEDLSGKSATRNKNRWTSTSMPPSCCVNEEVTMSPQAENGGVTASKKAMMTRADLKDSRLAMPTRCPAVPSLQKGEISSDLDKACSAASGRPAEIRNKGGRYSLLQKRQSDSALVKPRRRGDRLLLPLQQTAIQEWEEDELCLLMKRALTLMKE
jgi:hypothetical protein